MLKLEAFAQFIVANLNVTEIFVMDRQTDGQRDRQTQGENSILTSSSERGYDTIGY